MDIKKILETVKSKDFSGVVYLEDKKDIVLAEANGYSNRPEKISNNLETKFAIASGTKFFTALGIMKLVEAGKLSLDDKALSFINYDFQSYDKDVTIKQLLTHTSGIPDYYDEDEISETGLPKLNKAWYDLRKPSDYLEVLPQKEMLAGPGKVFKYNNSAFVLLAIIIENITGDYYQWLKTEVFEPAGMNNTDFYYFDQLPFNTASGYIEMEDGNYRTNIYDLPIRGGGDGGLYTNVYDMAKFWHAFMSGRLVNQENIQKILYPHYLDQSTAYGLGVWLKAVDDKYYPVIVGEDPGVSFVSGMTKDFIYVVISNTQHGAWMISELLD
jgi:CubicO group peptidase (beta-lactamase class C family)